MTLPLIQLDDLQVNYRIFDCADSNAETIVMSHGMGLNMQLWGSIIPLLNERYRVVVYDIRGNGGTSQGKHTLTWDVLIHDLHLLVQSLGLTSYYLFGHGLGATIAVKYSMAYPQQVKGLVLFSIPVVYPKQTIDRIISTRKKLTEAGTMLPLALEMVKTITLQPENSPVYNKIVEAYCEADVSMYFDIFNIYLTISPKEDFEHVSCPIMALAGDHDPMYITTFTLSAEVLKNTRFLIVPNSSNMMFVDQPALTVEWINNFISSIQLKQNGTRDHFHQVINLELFDTVNQIYSEGSKKVESGNTLQVDFLSSFRVQINGNEKLDGWNQRYAKSLLLYLVFHPTATREQLCDALFPDIPIKKALMNLKVYLNNLKKLLIPQGGDHSLLFLDKEHVSLQCELRSDVLKFIEHIQKVNLESNDAIKWKASKAILLSLPEILAPGVFDDWFRDYRESIELHIVELAKWTAIQEQQQGNLREALVLMRIALRFQPENEALFHAVTGLAADFMDDGIAIKSEK